MQQTGGIFQTGSSSNFLIQGGQFVQNVHAQLEHKCYEADDGFKHLQAHVAPTAYATQQEGDAPKCHPNTRMAILNFVMDWVLVATMGLQWMLWINGAAGAGKSAIARSIVDLCLKQDVVIVRFFFFRTDPTRNTIKPLVATLAYQLIRAIPALNAIISRKIQSDPLIFNESLETQLDFLIFQSLQKLHKESPLGKAIVLLADGVDECSGDENQVNIVHTIAQFVAEKSVPLIVIFASRTEPQLKMAFDEPKVDGILQRLPLDTDYCAADDIRLFLNDSFSKIKRSHPFRSSIPPEWPTPPLVQEIIEKSSNQFIYASVVIKFLSSPRLHPVQQLEIVRGLRPIGKLTPFAQLDALYQHIFSEVHDFTCVTGILVVYIVADPEAWHIHEMIGITDDDIGIALADLTSVISYDKGEITFLHASLPDFLLDQSHAQQYYIDKGFWCEQLAIKYLGKGQGNLSALNKYLSLARCTPQLQDALYTFQPSNYFDFYGFASDYVDVTHKMDFGNGGELYCHQLKLTVHSLHESDPMGELDELGKKHDIKGILDQITREKAVARQTEAPVEEVTPQRVKRSSRKGLSKVPPKTRFTPYHKRK